MIKEIIALISLMTRFISKRKFVSKAFRFRERIRGAFRVSFWEKLKGKLKGLKRKLNSTRF